jgi:hypothetical protein
MLSASAILSSVACQISIYPHIISKTARLTAAQKKWIWNVCEFSLQLLCKNIPHYKKNWAKQQIKNGYWSWPVTQSDFNQKFNLLGRFLKSSQIGNSMKTCWLEAEFFHVDRWTNRHDKTVTLRKYALAPKHRISRNQKHHWEQS